MKYFLVPALCAVSFAQQPVDQSSKPAAPAPVKPAAAKPVAKKAAPSKPATTAGSTPATAGGLFNQAPPEANRKLLATVQQFFQLHVEGKFRQVAPLVAEDSQDDYFNSEKTKFREFEILKVEYSKDFKRAKVTTVLGINHVFRGQTMPLKAPMASNWKIEKGEWRWFVDREVKKATPFGPLTPGPGDPKDFLITRPQSVSQVLGQVRAEKQELRLSSFNESSDSVVIENQMPGVVSLKFACEALAGLTCSLADTELKAGQKTKLMVKYVPVDKAPKPSRRAEIVVTETGARIVLNMVFTVPEEMLKNVPQP